jgi:hypothetical protein
MMASHDLETKHNRIQPGSRQLQRTVTRANPRLETVIFVTEASSLKGVESMKLTDFKVLTFDCYGTLIDWEGGMLEALKPLTSKAERPVSCNDILTAHARHESSQQCPSSGFLRQTAA